MPPRRRNKPHPKRRATPPSPPPPRPQPDAEPSEPPETTAAPRPTLSRSLIALALVVVAIVSLGVVFTSVLTAATPSWWRSLAHADHELAQRAEQLENAASYEITRVRAPAARVGEGERRAYASEPWAVTITESAASAWLTARLPKWLASQQDMPDWPREFSELQVHFAEDTARLGVRYAPPTGAPRILTATVCPELRDDGSVWLRADWFHIGRLPVPAWWLIREAKRELPDSIEADLGDDDTLAELVNMLEGAAPVSTDPVLALPDGRRVKLLALQIKPGALTITCRTESGAIASSDD